MKLSGTKTFCAVVIAFLIVALGSTAQTQKQPDCGKAPGHGNPPWFKGGGKCNNEQRTIVSSYTIGWPKRKPPETDCYLTILVCGNALVHRDTKNPLGTKCPAANDFAQPTICCDEFNKAVKSKQPCDPMQDADCDGIPNDKDPDPLGPNPPDPDSDDKCKQLGVDVYKAYLKAGADELKTATQAGGAAREYCMKRRAEKNCGTTREPWEGYDSNPPPTYPKDPDPDDKCKQLGQDVYDAYLKAGANDHTAGWGGGNARDDCMKRRASKAPQ